MMIIVQLWYNPIILNGHIMKFNVTLNGVNIRAQCMLGQAGVDRRWAECQEACGTSCSRMCITDCCSASCSALVPQPVSWFSCVSLHLH